MIKLSIVDNYLKFNDVSMTTLEILKAARELLAVPERWCQGVSAKDKAGVFVDRKRDTAHSFCIVGAIGRSSIDYDSFDLACDHLRSVQPMVSSLANWNDAPGRTHAEVSARFDEAIARLEGGL